MNELENLAEIDLTTISKYVVNLDRLCIDTDLIILDYLSIITNRVPNKRIRNRKKFINNLLGN